MLSFGPGGCGRKPYDSGKYKRTSPEDCKRLCLADERCTFAMIHYRAKKGQCVKKFLFICTQYKGVPDYGQPRCARYTGAMCELASSKPHEKLYFHTFIKGG